VSGKLVKCIAVFDDLLHLISTHNLTRRMILPHSLSHYVPSAPPPMEARVEVLEGNGYCESQHQVAPKQP